MHYSALFALPRFVLKHRGLLPLSIMLLLLAACGTENPEPGPTPTAIPAFTPVVNTPAPPPTDTPEAEPTAAEAEATTAEEASTAATAAEEPATDEETAADGEDGAENGATDEVAASEESAGDGDAAAADSAAEPRVFFQQPTNNAVIPVTSTVVMGFEGVLLEPSGDVVDGSGHMHILVDTDFIEPGNVIPADSQHIHFGDASTTAELVLSPGSHTLRLQFANGAHIALEGDQYRAEIVVSVHGDAPAQSVHFAQPRDGAIVPPSFDVVMAAAGISIEPAGDIKDDSGHMHILVNTDFIAPGDVIPADDQHIHFGTAQLTTTLDLPPGEHTLRLQLANGAHRALDGAQYRDEIMVTVAEDTPAQQVQFVSPANGDTVSQTFAVAMSAAGLFVESSGQVLRTEGGHMHILVDTDFIEAGNVIPADDQHIHFGGGQLSTELTLEPGEHILRLQMANGAHLALDGEQYRAEIMVTVE